MARKPSQPADTTPAAHRLDATGGMHVGDGELPAMPALGAGEGEWSGDRMDQAQLDAGRFGAQDGRHGQCRGAGDDRLAAAGAHGNDVFFQRLIVLAHRWGWAGTP